MGGQSKSRDASASPLRLAYLTAYNILFAGLWVTIFVKTVLQVRNGSSKFELFEETEPMARWVQTASLIEVVHAAVGMSLSHPLSPFSSSVSSCYYIA